MSIKADELAADLKIVVAISQALYPILFPSDPVQAEERKKQYAEVEHLATMVWNAFSGKYSPHLTDLTSVHWGGLSDLFHSIQNAVKRSTNAVATTAGEVAHTLPSPSDIADNAKAFTEEAMSPIVSGIVKAEAAAARVAKDAGSTAVNDWGYRPTPFPTNNMG
jgi:hypothetical protein